ncbi:MAG: ATP-binding protein [Candidatus Saccharimonadales bacterium]
MAEKIPISGGPHTGKTTLLNALKARFPEAYFVPEPATNVITRELAIEQANPEYVPCVPWIDYRGFGPLVADESEVLEARIPPEARLAFQDRSLIDTVAYSRLNGFDEFVPEVWQRIALAQYSFALICQPVGTYTANVVRRETEDEALQTHLAIEHAYRESGIEVIDLPAVDVDTRLEIVAKALGNRGLNMIV